MLDLHSRGFSFLLLPIDGNLLYTDADEPVAPAGGRRFNRV